MTDWNELGRRAGITPEQVREWLEDAKQKQREWQAALKDGRVKPEQYFGFMAAWERVVEEQREEVL